MFVEIIKFEVKLVRTGSVKYHSVTGHFRPKENNFMRNKIIFIELSFITRKKKKGTHLNVQKFVLPFGAGKHFAVIWLNSKPSSGHTHSKEPGTFSHTASPHTSLRSSHSFISTEERKI